MNGEGNSSKDFVNCFDGNDHCIFSVAVKKGVNPDELASFISSSNERVQCALTSTEPKGVIVKY